MTSNTPEDLVELQNAVGERKGNAIAKFVDGRIAAAFADNHAQLEEMAARVERLFAQHGPTPEVRQAAQVVGSAAAANQAAQQGNPSLADVDADSARVEQARQVVSQADPASQSGSGNHEERICALEERQSGLVASVEGAQTAAANAIAIARFSGGGALMRASQVALTVFAIVGVTYWLVWWLTPLDYQLLTNLGLALGAGGLAGWIALVWAGQHQDGSAAAASAEAASGHGQRSHHDAGLDIVQRAHGGSSAAAGARQGGGQSRAGASAATH